MLKNSLSTPAYEKVFIREALFDSKIRLDGRSPLDLRNIRINLTRGETQANAHLTLGTTQIIVIVSGNIVAPYPDKPNEGSIQFNTEISSNAELLGITNSEISRLLERIIRDSETLDTESLCIVSGEKVWEIRVEVRVLDGSGGNIIDAVVLASMAALRAFRKPEVNVVETEVIGKNTLNSKIKIFSSEDREPLPLSLQHTPLSVTLGLFKRTPVENTSKEILTNDEKISYIVDPSSQEELAMDGKITFSLNAHKELCAVSKPGGVSLSVKLFMELAQVSNKIVLILHDILNNSLAELEKSILASRQSKLEQDQKYNSIVLAQKKELGEEMDIEENTKESGGGIDRNDPILQWDNLHKAVSVREK